MLGDENVDSLILGTTAQTQSHSLGNKRTTVKLGDTKCKKVQLIVNHRQVRVGSVSISIRKLQQGFGRKFLHWATLFDQIDDDLFEGDLGEDEEDLPRVLLEYQVCKEEPLGEEKAAHHPIMVEQTIHFSERCNVEKRFKGHYLLDENREEYL